MKAAYAEPMAAVGTPATPLSQNAKARGIARLEKSQEDMLCLMKAAMSQMQHMSNRYEVICHDFFKRCAKSSLHTLLPQWPHLTISRGVSEAAGMREGRRWLRRGAFR
eukprot:6214822-Pleurochrysis_carterae.AAC.8